MHVQGERGETLYEFNPTEERLLRDVVQSGNTAALALTLQAFATFMLGEAARQAQEGGEKAAA